MLALVQILTGAATIGPTFAKAMEWSDSFPNLNPPEADNVPVSGGALLADKVSGWPAYLSLNRRPPIPIERAGTAPARRWPSMKTSFFMRSKPMSTSNARAQRVRPKQRPN